jgi:hypothetical protein
VNETDLDAHDYMKSLALTEEPSEVHGTDGAALWRIADDHFVLLVCSDIEHTHRGPALLRRVLPPHWAVFYETENPEQEFIARHFGPVLGEN